ncbi:ECF transporter S component [Fusicatenibacter sp.]
MNANRTLKLTTLALCGVLNILGGTIALLLRLPVYLDSIGTVLAAALFGPVAGLVPGLISGLISGMTSDVYAFYYIPVQLVIGLFAGLVFYRLRPAKAAGSRREGLSFRSMGRKLFPAALAISLPGTVVSSTITALVFGGITSSGSTVLVQLFHSLGMNLTLSVCVVQALTDFADRIIVLAAVLVLLPAVQTVFGSITSKSGR